MTTLIDIGPATIEGVKPDFVVVRFKPGSVADGNAFKVSMEARRKHFSATPHVVMLVADDDTDFDPKILAKNHYVGQETEPFTLAMALVCREPTVRNILELYFAMHRAAFPVMFFMDEAEAMPWVEAQRTLAHPTTSHPTTK